MQAEGCGFESHPVHQSIFKMDDKMTKAVRIENGDMNRNIAVVIEEHRPDGSIATKTLFYPTQMYEFTLWEGKNLKIYERPLTDEEKKQFGVG